MKVKYALSGVSLLLFTFYTGALVNESVENSWETGGMIVLLLHAAFVCLVLKAQMMSRFWKCVLLANRYPQASMILELVFYGIWPVASADFNAENGLYGWTMAYSLARLFPFLFKLLSGLVFVKLAEKKKKKKKKEGNRMYVFSIFLVFLLAKPLIFNEIRVGLVRYSRDKLDVYNGEAAAIRNVLVKNEFPLDNIRRSRFRLPVYYRSFMGEFMTTRECDISAKYSPALLTIELKRRQNGASHVKFVSMALNSIIKAALSAWCLDNRDMYEAFGFDSIESPIIALAITDFLHSLSTSITVPLSNIISVHLCKQADREAIKEGYGPALLDIFDVDKDQKGRNMGIYDFWFFSRAKNPRNTRLYRYLFWDPYEIRGRYWDFQELLDGKADKEQR